jgi:DsbC/DsbD-like thiol-disulfide interchange protein
LQAFKRVDGDDKTDDSDKIMTVKLSAAKRSEESELSIIRKFRFFAEFTLSKANVLRMTYLYFFLILFALHFGAMSAYSQIYNGAPVTHVSLLAGNIQPGKGFTLGIRMQLEPGWHAYWKNPGDAGLPVSAELLDAHGYKAGELKFPTPRKIITGGDVLFGYDSEVVFLLPIKTPPIASSSPQFTVRMNWLACKEVCLPGEVSIAFNADSISMNDRQENQRILDHWTARLPQPGAGFNMGNAGIVVTEKDGKQIVFIKFIGMAPGTVTDFFPEAIEGFVTDYFNMIIGEDGITLTLTPETKNSKLTEIKGIAVIGTSGYEVDFKVNR